MRSSDLAGTGKVFGFTLAQYLKSKGTIVIMLVMALAAIGSIFIAGWSMDAGEEYAGISSVAIMNRTGHALSAEDIAACDAALAGLYEDAPERAEAELTIELKDGAYLITAVGDASEEELAALEKAAQTAFDIIRAGGSPLAGGAMTLEEYLEPEDDGHDFAAGFTVSYVYAILVLMLVMLSSSYIIRSVVEEKASRLVEMLMISVRPLALILGKVMASMCLVVIQLAIMLGGAYAAAKIMGEFSGASLVQLVDATGAGALLAGLDGFSIFAALISILLGFFTFSLIGGLSASCCDSMEDINTASTATVLTALAGYLVAMVATAFEGTAAAVFSLVPFVSVFVAPVKFLEGSISAGILFAAWALQLVVIALLAALCRKVYAALIIHTGSRVKLRGLLRIAGIGGGK